MNVLPSLIHDNETAIAQLLALPFTVIAGVFGVLFAVMVATKPDPAYMVECRKLGGEPIVMKRGTPPGCVHRGLE